MKNTALLLILSVATAAIACTTLGWKHLDLGTIDENQTLGQHLDDQFGHLYGLDVAFEADVTYRLESGGQYAWVHTRAIEKKCNKNFSQSLGEEIGSSGGGLPDSGDPGSGSGMGLGESCFTDPNGWACTATPSGESCEYFPAETICGVG